MQGLCSRQKAGYIWHKAPRTWVLASRAISCFQIHLPSAASWDISTRSIPPALVCVGGSLGVCDAPSAIEQDPLYSSWLGYSALNRATQVRVPVAELDARSVLQTEGWIHLAQGATYLGACQSSNLLLSDPFYPQLLLGTCPPRALPLLLCVCVVVSRLL